MKIRTPPNMTAVDRVKRKNGIVSAWLFQRPWRQETAEAQIRYNKHAMRSAWNGNWSGLAILFRDPAVHAQWQATGRLRRFFQGHVAQRWSSSIKEAELHQLDPMLVLTKRSSKCKGNFNLAERERATTLRRRVPECCCCCTHRGNRHDQLQQTQKGHCFDGRLDLLNLAHL